MASRPCWSVPPLAAAHLGRARCLVKLGEWLPAREAFAAVLKLAPEHYSAWLEAGHLCRQMGEVEQALASYQWALAVDGARHEAWLSLTRTLEQAGRDAEAALAHYQAHRAQHPQDTSLASSIAMCALYCDSLDGPQVASLTRELFAPLGEGARSKESFVREPLVTSDDQWRRTGAGELPGLPRLDRAAPHGLDPRRRGGDAARARCTVQRTRGTPAGHGVLLCAGGGLPVSRHGPAHAERPLTFGSFNNVPKLTPHTLRLWARILAELPEARLVLKAPSFADAAAQSAFRERLLALGVAAERVAFRGPVGLSDMMAEYGDIDIALDPVPYNGGTTTLQAMWMGVPVVVKRPRTSSRAWGRASCVPPGWTTGWPPTTTPMWPPPWPRAATARPCYRSSGKCGSANWPHQPGT